MIVRFRTETNSKWLYGQSLGLKGDGSVTIGPVIPDEMYILGRRAMVTGMRSIMPEHVQVRTVGPRGGEVWEEWPDSDD